MSSAILYLSSAIAFFSEEMIMCAGTSGNNLRLVATICRKVLVIIDMWTGKQNEINKDKSILL